MCIKKISEKLRLKVTEWLDLELYRLDYMQIELNRLKAEVERLQQDKERDAADTFLRLAKAYYRQEQTAKHGEESDKAQES